MLIRTDCGTVKETVEKYQTDSEPGVVQAEVRPFTADELGSLLVNSVKDKEISEVRTCNLTPFLHLKINIVHLFIHRC